MSGHQVPIIDVQRNGIGDVVVACWIIHSALAAARTAHLNPRNRREVASLLGIPPSSVTTLEATDWSTTPGIGHQMEYSFATRTPLTRFDAWARSLGFIDLKPVRPTYCAMPEDQQWAIEQWLMIDPTASKKRVLLFPGAAYPIRAWPRAYFVDLALSLQADGVALAAMADSEASTSFMPVNWWAGYSVGRVAAMARQADVVVANDSGPAHLSGTIGTRTVAIHGPTDPRIVFDHDPNVMPIGLDREMLACVHCHFAIEKGFRVACEVGGCQALMRLAPVVVIELVHQILATACHQSVPLPPSGSFA